MSCVPHHAFRILAGKFEVPNIMIEKIRSIARTGNFINAHYKLQLIWPISPVAWTAHVLKSGRFSFLIVATKRIRQDFHWNSDNVIIFSPLLCLTCIPISFKAYLNATITTTMNVSGFPNI